MRQNTTYSGRKLFKSFFRRWNFCGLHSENTGLEFPPTWVFVDRVKKFTLGLIKTGLPSQKFHLEALFHRWNTLVVVWFKTHITILSLVSPPDRQTNRDRQTPLEWKTGSSEPLAYGWYWTIISHGWYWTILSHT